MASSPTLEEKLAEILDDCAESYYPLHEYPDQPIYTDRNKATLAESIEQIKAAFKDSGYSQRHQILEGIKER